MHVYVSILYTPRIQNRMHLTIYIVWQQELKWVGYVTKSKANSRQIIKLVCVIISIVVTTDILHLRQCRCEESGTIRLNSHNKKDQTNVPSSAMCHQALYHQVHYPTLPCAGALPCALHFQVYRPTPSGTPSYTTRDTALHYQVHSPTPPGAQPYTTKCTILLHQVHRPTPPGAQPYTTMCTALHYQALRPIPPGAPSYTITSI